MTGARSRIMRFVDAIVESLTGTYRIHADAADRLLDHDFAAEDHAGLVAVLRAAAAPARLAELSGEQDAMARFAAARADVVGRPNLEAGSSRRRMRRAIAFTVATAVLLAGVTFYAASAGAMPGPLQSYAHRVFWPLGVPGPQSRPNNAPPPTAPAPTNPHRTAAKTTPRFPPDGGRCATEYLSRSQA